VKSTNFYYYRQAGHVNRDSLMIHEFIEISCGLFRERAILGQIAYLTDVEEISLPHYVRFKRLEDGERVFSGSVVIQINSNSESRGKAFRFIRENRERCGENIVKKTSRDLGAVRPGNRFSARHRPANQFAAWPWIFMQSTQKVFQRFCSLLWPPVSPQKFRSYCCCVSWQ